MLWIRFVLIIAVFSNCFSVGCAGPNSAIDKHQAEAQRNLGDVLLNQGQHSAALQELLKAEQLDPDDPYTQNSLGMAYASKGKLDLAVTAFKKALALKNDYAPARNNLGSTYILQSNWDAAIACLMELTGNLVYATPHYPLYNIGWAYYNKKDYQMAERYFNQALEAEPNYSRALWGLGLTCKATNRLDTAIEKFEKAVQVDPQYSQAFLDLGKLYEIKGQKKKALECYERAASVSPNSPAGQAASEAIKAISK